MPKPSALTSLSHLMFCGALILLSAAPPAAGQSSEPEKAQPENVPPLFHLNTGQPSGLRVEPWGSGKGTVWKGVDLPAALQPQSHFPQQPPASVPTLILPTVPNIARFAQTVPAPALKTSNPFKVEVGPTADAGIPKIPYAVTPQNPTQQNLCSVPLLRVQPAPATNFTIRQAPAPRMDSAMVVKPSAPSCDEKTSAPKPGNTLPLPPERR